MVTRAFSGRYARGLANDFTARYDDVAPLGYPEVNQMTGPLRRAAVAAGDPHGTNLWAGTAWRRSAGQRNRHRGGIGWRRPMSLSRRRLLITGTAATVLAACGVKSSPAHPTLSDPAEPLPPVGQRIADLEKRHNAFVGLYAQNLDSKLDLAHRDGDPFAMCSTFKAYLSARVLQKAQAGSCC